VPGSNQPFETAVFNENWDKIDAEAVAADTRLDAIEALNTTQDNRLTAVETVNTTQDGRLATAEANIVALGAGATVQEITGTTYSFLNTDANDFVRFTSDSAVTATVTNTLTPGQYINCVQDGLGQVTFVAGAGVNLQSPSGLKSSVRFTWVSIICVASGQYRLIGGLTA
jgi:hypothetical protein